MVVAMTCRGPAGCRLDGTVVHCDYTHAALGDPCDVDDFTCANDGKHELRCDGAHFVAASTCKGPDGCTLTPAHDNKGFTLSCDYHVADIGEACMKDDEWACSSDMKSELRCANGGFVVAQACKGPHACRVTKNRGDDTTTVACDHGIADVGEPCVGKGDACSADGRSELVCDNGQFGRARSCPHGCTVGDNDITCR